MPSASSSGWWSGSRPESPARPPAEPARGAPIMLFDTHTNLMWYPDHLSEEFVRTAWEAKRAKMKLSPDVYFAGSESQQKNAFDSTPEQLLEATRGADKV